MTEQKQDFSLGRELSSAEIDAVSGGNIFAYPLVIVIIDPDNLPERPSDSAE